MNRHLTLAGRIMASVLVALFGTGIALAESGSPTAVTPEATDEMADTDAESPEEGPTLSKGNQQVAEKLAAEFHVETEQIIELREQGLGFGEIDNALSLANQLPGGITEENLAQVMELRQGEDGKMGWGKIAQELGVKLGPAKHADIVEEPPSDVEPLPPAEPVEPVPTADTSTLDTQATPSLSRPGTPRQGSVRNREKTSGPATPHPLRATQHGGGTTGHGGLGHGGGGLGGAKGKSGSAPGHNR